MLYFYFIFTTFPSLRISNPQMFEETCTYPFLQYTVVVLISTYLHYRFIYKASVCQNADIHPL